MSAHEWILRNIVHCSFVHCSLFIVHCSSVIVHCSSFIVHCSLFIVHCSLFIVHCSLFIVHCSSAEMTNEKCQMNNEQCYGLLHWRPSRSISPSVSWGPHVPASYLGISSFEFCHASSIGMTISHPRSVISRRAYRVESPSMQSSSNRS